MAAADFQVRMTILSRGVKYFSLKLLRAQQNCHPDRSGGTCGFFSGFSHSFFGPLRSAKNRTASLPTSSQVQFPFLSNEIVSEAVMRFFFHQAEAGSLINAMGSRQNALRPKNNFPITSTAGKADAFSH